MAQDPGKERQDRASRADARIAFVVSTFHEDLTRAMLDSARRELRAAGLADEDLPVAWVPGSFELPLLARRFARDPRVDAVICLGLVLKGETSHDLYVARGAADGIRQVMLETDKPVLLGVLTCQTLEQARDRALPVEAGGKQDKGRELARAALEVLAALDSVDAVSTAARTVGFPHPPASTTGARAATPQAPGLPLPDPPKAT
jgi:6,7-dimethyl-8-ribityllumazine synthase